MSFWGRLTLDAFHHDMIIWGAGIGMIVGGLSIFLALIYFKKLGWLWRNYITSLDHKKIGIMYIAVSFIMLLKSLS